MAWGVYSDAIRFLAENGKHFFHAKLAKKKRLDHLCFWVTREDFFPFEEFIKTREQDLISPLPFVAYRGKMGIGREMASWRSQNAVQAEMISSYLQTIEESSQIDLSEMYTLFVAAWNGDLPKDHPMTKAFKEANAQELIVSLESLAVILGGEKIGDDHLLLNEDENLWGMIKCSKNWYELGEYLKGNRQYY